LSSDSTSEDGCSTVSTTASLTTSSLDDSSTTTASSISVAVSIAASACGDFAFDLPPLLLDFFLS
jgi:exo-beta-1,3-glucanase (GH17 family)